MPGFSYPARKRRSTAALARIAGWCAMFALGGFSPPGLIDLKAEEPTEAAAESSDEGVEFNAVVASADQIAKWIEELGHDAFRVRQAAAAQLVAAGASARDPLSEVADGPDPETRAAARRLIALIDRSEFHRRLEAFAADVDGRRGLTLPGWEQYQALVGGDAAARELFVDMQRQEGSLLSAVFGGSSQPPDQLWEERLARILWHASAGNRSVGPPLGSCAAMLLVGSVDEMDVSDRAAVLLENLIQRPPILESIQPGNAKVAVRRLVAGWILHCSNKNEVILARRLGLAAIIDLKEALPLALAVAGGDPQYARVQPLTRATAVSLIGQHGGEEHIEHVEPLLEDASICLPGQPRMAGGPAPNVQVRDVALVMLLQLTGQRPTDYGYVHARFQGQRLFQLQTLHLENDERRSEAIAKWRAWRAAKKQSPKSAD